MFAKKTKSKKKLKHILRVIVASSCAVEEKEMPSYLSKKKVGKSIRYLSKMVEDEFVRIGLRSLLKSNSKANED